LTPPGTEVAATDDPAKDPEPDPKPDLDPEPVPSKLTVVQFLKRSSQKPGIDGLIRSLYSSKVMSFEEWKKETDDLLKKKTL
jgi:hypothetical protein